MELKDKAVEIKGKKYVLVSDRILEFNKLYSEGYIKTELLSDTVSKTIIFKAIASPDGNREFVGHAQETIGDGFINKTSALENAETSAVGRALAMMGIGVIDSVASVDEIVKAENKNSTPKKAPIAKPKIQSPEELEARAGKAREAMANAKDLDTLDKIKGGLIKVGFDKDTLKELQEELRAKMDEFDPIM